MKNDKILKILVLSLCLCLLLCLTACKDDNTSDDSTLINSDLSKIVDSADPDRDNGGVGNVTSGIELEDDVFEIDDTATNTSSSNTNSSDNVDNENQSNNQSADETQSNSSSDNTSDNESGEASEDEDVTESDDGTVKLPIDWFD